MIFYAQLYCTVYSVYTLNPGARRFPLAYKEYFNFVRYYRKEIFVKGRGPVGLRISKEKY